MQKYTEIPSSFTLTASRSEILDNDKSIMSCFSGTTFPTVNLQVGMLCYRTDKAKLYQLTDVKEKTWVGIADTANDITEILDNRLPLTGGTVTGLTKFTANTPSTSSLTGSLVVTGGIGVSGDVFAKTFNGSLKGNADTASKLETSRTISFSDGITVTPTSFNGSANVVIPVTEIDSKFLVGTISTKRLEGMYDCDISGRAKVADTADSVTNFTTSRNDKTDWLVYGSKGADGIVEVGRYMNFHASNTSKETYTVQLDAGSGQSSTLKLSGSLLATGNVTAFSDKRLKDNVCVIDDAVAKVQQLKGVTFNRVDLKDKDQRFVGLIAQDVQKVMPEAISVAEDERKTLTVDYQGLIGLLVQAIKELDDKLKKLEAKKCYP